MPPTARDPVSRRTAHRRVRRHHRRPATRPLGHPHSGPTYARTKDKSHLLAACFRSSLGVADELGAATVAFPAISTGVYRWPLEDAARIAVATVQATPTKVREITFVLFGRAAYDAFASQG